MTITDWTTEPGHAPYRRDTTLYVNQGLLSMERLLYSGAQSPVVVITPPPMI